ncbi:interactor of constitutive active ROPs 4-like [Curcuma longa]|uniref:interactor of constitutive active ROPs 4-like n=1 Tax=Curcuma longa TaxID=136217 RepID=UPI003D9F230E
MSRARGMNLNQQQQQQQQSPRVPLHLKNTISPEANNSLHLRPAVDQSLKLKESKCGAKAADLATKLSKAREELEKLRDRLDSAELAKEDAEQALEKAKKQVCSSAVGNPQVVVEEEEEEPQRSLERELKLEEQRNDGEVHESAVIMELKAMILEKDKKVEILLEENMIFKRKSEEEAIKLSAAARAKEEELEAKIVSVEAELKESEARAGTLAARLAATEGEKETVEAEMRRMRVQMEQWRKAAEAATALLAAGDGGGFMVEMGGRRCRLMDKHLDGWGSPAEMGEEEGGRGWRKMAGMQVLGEMWKKRTQH